MNARPLVLVGVGALGALVGVLALWLAARALDAEHGFVRRVELGVPPEAAWERLADPTRWPAWSATLARAERVAGDGPPLYRLELAGGARLLLAVAESRPPSRLALQSGGTGAPYELAWTLEVEPTAGGCRVVWSERATVRDPWLRLRLFALEDEAALVERLLAELAGSVAPEPPPADGAGG